MLGFEYSEEPKGRVIREECILFSISKKPHEISSIISGKYHIISFIPKCAYNKTIPKKSSKNFIYKIPNYIFSYNLMDDNNSQIYYVQQKYLFTTRTLKKDIINSNYEISLGEYKSFDGKIEFVPFNPPKSIHRYFEFLEESFDDKSIEAEIKEETETEDKPVYDDKTVENKQFYYSYKNILNKDNQGLSSKQFDNEEQALYDLQNCLRKLSMKHVQVLKRISNFPFTICKIDAKKISILEEYELSMDNNLNITLINLNIHKFSKLQDNKRVYLLQA